MTVFANVIPIFFCRRYAMLTMYGLGLPWNATRPQLISASLLFHHQRRRHVHFLDVREARGWYVLNDSVANIYLLTPI